MSVHANIERLGGSVLSGVRVFGELAALLLLTIRGVIAGERRKGALAEQMFEIGNRSLLFIAVTMGFIGMVMVYQSGTQLLRVVGDLSQVGPGFLRLLIQEFGPSITALMLATRVGAGIAAEIGSMKVTEQIDALRMSGITPVDYLIAPRFLASVVMTAVLTASAILIAYGAGGITAWVTFDLNPAVYFDGSKVRIFDIAVGAIKTLSYGVAIPIVSGFFGLRARGSSQGVGEATTRAVIGSSFSVILLNFIISGLAATVFQTSAP